MSNSKTYGSQLLAAWLDSEGLSQSAAAARLGCSRPSISMWLRGTRPTMAWAMALERVAAIPLRAWLTPDERSVVDGRG